MSIMSGAHKILQQINKFYCCDKGVRAEFIEEISQIDVYKVGIFHILTIT